MKVKKAARIGEVKEYYFSRKLKEIARRNAQGAKVINLGLGSPDLSPPPAVIETLKSALTEIGVHKYQSYSGIPELRAAMADWYQRYFQVQLDKDSEVLPLIGSKEGIMHISMAFLEAGDTVLVPDPGYPTYSAAAKLCGASILNYQLNEKNNWLPDFDDLSRQELSKVKIMWVNYPHMPSGAKGSGEFFHELLAFAQAHDILICNDNPYSFILNDKPSSLLSIPGAKTHALELNSLSKSHHMAGWRIGMVCGNGDNLQSILRFKSNMDSGMFRATQLAAIEALNTPLSWHDEQNKIYTSRKKIAQKIMESINVQCRADQTGMFLWGKISDQWEDGFALSDYLLESSNVFITPGGIFGDAGKNYMRISLCSNLETLQEALDRIEKINQR